MADKRFREPEDGSGMRRAPWLVSCPRCNERAAVTDTSDVPTLSCPACGLVRSGPVHLAVDGLVVQSTAPRGAWRRDRTPRVHWPEQHLEPYELWLRRPCAGHVLWATNVEHLDYLESYVGAMLREGTHVPHQKLHHKLPTWMKVAKHRDEVLRGIAELRKRTAAY